MNILNKPYLFWDVDLENIDSRKHWRFIIARVLCFGFPFDVRELLEHYSKEQIIDTVKNSRVLDRKTATFWAVHLGLSTEDIRCLKKPSVLN